MNSLLPLFIILPLASAFLIPIIGRFWKDIDKTISSMVFLMLTLLCVWAIINWDRSPVLYSVGGWEPVDGIPIGIYLVFDGFSGLVLGIVNLIAFLSTLYAFGYIRKFTSENHFYTLVSLMVAGMNGVILSGDLFNLYVFLEIASIASYALVAFGVEKEELEASFKYQVLGGLASLIILFSVGLIYWTTGTLNLADISRVLAGQSDNYVVLFTQVALIAGFGLKAAIVPFHAWLPDAHSSAPSPISSMLSGILIKAIGVYVLIRLFFHMFEISYEIALILVVFGVLSIIAGGVLAIGQNDYKRMLAYSSISQVGYIITGIAIGMLVISRGGDLTIASLAIFGGLFHLLNHAVFKSLMFMTAGSVEYATGIRDLNKLGGLSGSMPVTSTTSLSGSMAISGLPPFGGFFSKLVIVIATIQAGYYSVAFIAALMSVITLAYFMKLQRRTFHGKAKPALVSAVEVPWIMRFPMIVLAVMCIALSFMMIPQIREITMDPAVNSLLDTIWNDILLTGVN